MTLVDARYAHLFWDLDGTLTDPKEGITRSVQHALARLGIPVDDPDVLTPFIGPPLSTSFRDLYGLTPAQTEQAVQFYRERFDAQGIFENRVYPGIPELLQDLAERGVVMAVATSKPTAAAERILVHFGLRGRFEAVYGAGIADGWEKRDVLARAAADLSPRARRETAMIGDHPLDMSAAHAFGLPAVAALYGYGDSARMLAEHPEHTARDIEELRGVLLPREA